MPIIFYQSNFCPECGNLKEQHLRWRHRYFCEHCAEKLGRRWDWLPIAFAVAGLAIGTLFNYGRREIIREVAVNQPAPAMAQSNLSGMVSAVDATAQLKPAPYLSAGNFFCGARTQKGTACKHRVAVAGMHCFQHEGKRAARR